MNNVLDQLLVFLKKKKTIACIVILISGIIITNVFSGMYKATIQDRQIESVAKVTYQNKQFKSIKESEVSKLLKNKEQIIIAIIDTSDNKGYSKVKKMFNSKATIEGLPKTVYVYQPIYDNTKLNKELKINEKNTFIVIENGEELGRYSFNDLSVGYEEIVNEIDTILNPKIKRTNPVRNDKTETEEESTTNSDGETHTSEVEFQN